MTKVAYNNFQVVLTTLFRLSGLSVVIASVERTRLPLKETLTQQNWRQAVQKLHLNRCHL